VVIVVIGFDDHLHSELDATPSMMTRAVSADLKMGQAPG
jgi:hypothetical protein